MDSLLQLWNVAVGLFKAKQHRIFINDKLIEKKKKLGEEVKHVSIMDLMDDVQDSLKTGRPFEDYYEVEPVFDPKPRHVATVSETENETLPSEGIDTPVERIDILDLSREERQEMIVELLDSNPIRVFRRTDLEHELGYILEGEQLDQKQYDSLRKLVQRDLRPLVEQKLIQKHETTTREENPRDRNKPFFRKDAVYFSIKRGVPQTCPAEQNYKVEFLTLPGEVVPQRG